MKVERQEWTMDSSQNSFDITNVLRSEVHVWQHVESHCQLI